MNDKTRLDLILLPGLDGTGLLFRPFLDALSGDVRAKVIAYPAQIMSLEEHARYVTERLPDGDFVLLAESFSSLVALSLLAKPPASLRGLIFCAGFAEPPRPWLLRLACRLPRAGFAMRATPDFLLRRYCLGPAAPDERVALLREALQAVPPDVLAHRLRIISEARTFRTGIPIPCAYIQGSRDPGTSRRCLMVCPALPRARACRRGRPPFSLTDKTAAMRSLGDRETGVLQ